MAKSKSNDESNTKLGPVPHHKASDDHNAEMDRLKRDPNYIQKRMDRQTRPGFVPAMDRQ